MTDYLKRAEAVLKALMNEWARSSSAAGTPEARAEVLHAKLAIVREFTAMAAVQRGVPLYAHPAGPERERETP